MISALDVCLIDSSRVEKPRDSVNANARRHSWKGLAHMSLLRSFLAFHGRYYKHDVPRFCFLCFSLRLCFLRVFALSFFLLLLLFSVSPCLRVNPLKPASEPGPTAHQNRKEGWRSLFLQYDQAACLFDFRHIRDRQSKARTLVS
jgi:hypothetical protein